MEVKVMSKTPIYVLDAQKNYHAKHDNISIVLPLGTKERIRKSTGQSVNSFINGIVERELKHIEEQEHSEILKQLGAEQLLVDVLPATKEKIEGFANKQGISVSEYAENAIEMKLQADSGDAELSPKIIMRSIEWLLQHGHSSDEALDFLKNWARKE